VKSRQWLAVVPLTAALAMGVAACGSSSNSDTGNNSASGSGGDGSSASGTVNGAGSTFAAPIYQQWGSDLKKQGITVNYQPVGSGAGVAALANKTADFAGSDPPLTADDKKTLGGPVIQVPMAIGAITVSYNVSGLQKGLRLDGPTIADIFMGKVTTWNDPEITKQNPGVNVPNTKITVVHRSDESGTTKGFTTFLSAYSPDWKSKIGADKTVKWPTGTGAKGNDGVAAAVKQTSGAIGYVEQAYALQNNFTYADVKNKSGKYIAPTLASTSAAGEGLTIPSDLGVVTIDSPNPTAYPISSQTFIDVHQDVCTSGMSAGNAKALKAFLNYGLTTGQGVAKQLFYAPLPANLLGKSKNEINKIQCNGSAIPAS
jgi:phosphate transport system substrate-binding protein